MNNMRERITRGDIKQERVEAIKVRSHPLHAWRKEVDPVARQCVILQQIAHLNFKHHNAPPIPKSQDQFLW